MSNEFNDNYEDYEEELDPVEKAKLDEIHNEEIENAPMDKIKSRSSCTRS